MKDYDYHILFYYGALAKIQQYQGQNGGLLQPPKDIDTGIEFLVGYEVPLRAFQHNYQRDEFAASRDMFLLALVDGNASAIMRITRNTDDAILYKKALRTIFPKDYAVAKRELEKLMSKFYKLTTEQYYAGSRVDIGTDGRGGNHITIDRKIRKNSNEEAISRW